MADDSDLEDILEIEASLSLCFPFFFYTFFSVWYTI